MTQNIIYTDNEYMAQGFTAQEVPKVRRHDELFNKGEDRTEEETMEMVDRYIKLIKSLHYLHY